MMTLDDHKTETGLLKQEMQTLRKHGSKREYKRSRHRWMKAMGDLGRYLWAVDVLRGASGVRNVELYL